MGTITRIISNQSEWISENEFDLISKENDAVFSSVTKVSIDGKKSGHQIGAYNYNEKKDVEVKDFPFGWWTYDYDGKKRVDYDKNDNTGFRSYLEKTVYFQLEVNDRVPLETSIQFKLYDYDTALGFDNLNPDDDKFDGKEVIRTINVREVDGKKRITIELFLEPIWKKEIVEDRGSFRDGCLDFYWKWNYDNTNWSSDKVILRVYPSLYKLRVKPALNTQTNALPEIYSHKGDIISFAIEQLPDGKIQKFVSMKIRTTTSFNSIEGINKFKKEIYTETIDLTRNRIESASYIIEDLEHIFTINGDFKKIFIEEQTYKVPVSKGSDIAVYNSIKKGVKFGKQAAEIFGHIQVLDEMRNMIPELSSNGQFNKPSLSTFIGFIPGAQIIAFGVGVLEWIAMDMIREMDEWIDEQMWISWQNTKHKGLATAKSFCDYNDWASKRRFKYYEVSKNLLNKILKGGFNNIDNLINESYSEKEAKTHTIFTNRVEDPEIEDFFDVIDCIFINDENKKSNSMFDFGF